MPIPLRTTRLLDPLQALRARAGDAAAGRQGPGRADARAKLLRMPGASLIAGRADPNAAITELEAVASDGTSCRCGSTGRRTPARPPLPVVVNFHGGGWVSGDARQSEWWCSSVAAQAGVVVVSVDYRLAPEHPFPGPPEDCYDATVWVGRARRRARRRRRAAGRHGRQRRRQPGRGRQPDGPRPRRAGHRPAGADLPVGRPGRRLPVGERERQRADPDGKDIDTTPGAVLPRLDRRDERSRTPRRCAASTTACRRR